MKIENENNILKAYTFGVPIKNHGDDSQFKRKVQFFDEKFGPDKLNTHNSKSAKHKGKCSLTPQNQNMLDQAFNRTSSNTFETDESFSRTTTGLDMTPKHGCYLISKSNESKTPKTPKNKAKLVKTKSKAEI